MQPKCSLKERRRGFSKHSSVDAAVSGRRCVLLGESTSTLFGLPKVDVFRNHWLRFVYNTTAQPKCSNLCNAFYGWQFREPRREQGWLCTKAIYKNKKRSIPTLLWQSGVSESATAGMFWYWLKYLLLTVQMQSFARNASCVCVCGVCACACACACVCACVWVWGEQDHITVEYYKILQIHTSIITVSVTRLCYISYSACGVRPITMHWVSWPIRADCTCWKEGLCRKLSVWERRGIEELK